MTSRFFLLSLPVVFFCIFTPTVSASKYCKINPRHVLCIYKVNELGPLCPKDAKIKPLSKRGRELLLLEINTPRHFIANKILKTNFTSNEIEMKWDNELASSAQAWANQCIYSYPLQEDLSLSYADERFPVSSRGARISNRLTLNHLTINQLQRSGLSNMLSESPAIRLPKQELPKSTNEMGEILEMFLLTDYKFVGCGDVEAKINNELVTLRFCHFGLVRHPSS